MVIEARPFLRLLFLLLSCFPGDWCDLFASVEVDVRVDKRVRAMFEAETGEIAQAEF